MKKIFTILVITLLLGCSSSKNDLSNNIIGTWRYTSLIENGMDISDSCDKMETMQIFENKSIIYTEYLDYRNGVPCRIDRTLNGTYSEINNTTFMITINGEALNYKLVDSNTLTASGQGDNGIVKITFKK